MKRFRILTATALIGAMVFGVTACGQPTPTTVTTEPTTTVTETETTPSESETTSVETTTETTVPTLSPDAYGAGLDKARDFNWNNATLGVVTSDENVYPDAPTYPAGQNIVFSFKSNEAYTLTSVVKVKEDVLNGDYGIDVIAIAPAIEGVDGNKIDYCSVNVTDGAYEITLNADVVEAGWCYVFAFTTETGSYSYIIVRCA